MEKIRIRVLSKPEFNQAMGQNNITDENVETRMKDSALISINDTEGSWNKSWFDRDHPNVIRLWFDDVENDEQKSPTNAFTCKAFSVEQAEQLFNFIKKNADKDFIVHCSAGISRSGAVGSFINDYLNSDMEYFEKANRHRILPNSHVSRLLNKLAWDEQSNN